VTIQDFQEYVLRLKQEAGLPATLAGDEGLMLGRPETEVRGVLVTWMGSVDALEMAAREHCNLVVVHEQVFFYDYWSAAKRTSTASSWQPMRTFPASRPAISSAKLPACSTSPAVSRRVSPT
jgi:hypothetical protein